MFISLIAAHAKNKVIGKNGALIWNLKKDLAYFKARTQGHYILMGRKTYASLPSNLPGRKIIVLTRQKDFIAPGCMVAHSLKAGIMLARQAGETELFICGGGEVYAESIKCAHKLYLTELAKEFSGDVYFPNFNLSDWQLLKEITATEQEIKLTFREYLRKV